MTPRERVFRKYGGRVISALTTGTRTGRTDWTAIPGLCTLLLAPRDDPVIRTNRAKTLFLRCRRDGLDA